MAYARASFYINKEETVPLLPEHGKCVDGKRQIFFGEQHLYAFCIYCHAKFVLLSNEEWKKLNKSDLWVGPAEHGIHE